MKTLQINSFYYNRGGDCTHMFATSKLLEQYGHTVIHFSMNHPQNFNNKYSKYWPSYIDFKDAIKDKSPGNILKVIARTIYSFESKKCIAALLDEEKPDIIHIHNILHHITPSILGEIKKRNIPIVWTLHDYTIICPNTSFLTEKGEVCEACKKRRFFMAPIKKCKKNSLGASGIAMLENYLHRLITVYRHVDKFIAPSEFLKRKFIEYGMGDRVTTLNNFMDVKNIQPNYTSNGYYIYIGRLTHIKGIDVLVEAAKLNPEIKLKVVGDGDLLEYYRSQNISNIDFEGFKSGEELHNLIAGAMFAVVPSQWYENFPYSVLEPMAFGKPVIGSSMGGIPEQIDHEKTGYIFEHKDINQLAQLIAKLSSDKTLQINMGRNARKKVEEIYNQDVHYEKLMNIYNSVIKK